MTFNFEQASHSDLLAEALRIHEQANSVSNKLMYVEKAFANRDRQYSEAKSIITELIENDEIQNEEAVKSLIDIFDIEILKEVEFTLTVEISGTVHIPLGSELDEYAFDIDDITYNYEPVEVNSQQVELFNWNFTE